MLLALGEVRFLQSHPEPIPLHLLEAHHEGRRRTRWTVVRLVRAWLVVPYGYAAGALHGGNGALMLRLPHALLPRDYHAVMLQR